MHAQSGACDRETNGNKSRRTRERREMITKTDFMEFLDTPMHMWAEKHDQAAPAPTAFDLHLMEQGKAIEKLARGYLPVYLASQGAGQELSFEKTFTDGQFQTRVDALVHDHDQGAYDLYEIKS